MPPGKARIKAIIDEHFHREGLSPEGLSIDVADRSAPAGVRTLGGPEVAGAGGGFIELRDGGRIPFHKVRAIRSLGRVVFSRAG